jgi:hypothetical protein
MLPWRMAFVPEGQHDRSLARRAWEKRPSKAPSRRVRYDRAQLTHNYFSSKCASCSSRNARYSSWKAFRDHFHSAQRYRIRNFLPSNLQIDAHTRTNHTVPYGTALLGWRCPRHFVPGYDHAVPPGRKRLRAKASI